MALLFYDSEQTLLDSQALFQGPVPVRFDGTLGGAYEFKAHVRNNDNSKYYTNIVVSVLSYVEDETLELLNVEGWSIKLLAGSRQPTEKEWNTVNHGNQINLGALGEAGTADTSTYLAFWVRFYCPGNTAASNFSGACIKVQATESVV